MAAKYEWAWQPVDLVYTSLGDSREIKMIIDTKYPGGSPHMLFVPMLVTTSQDWTLNEDFKQNDNGDLSVQGEPHIDMLSTLKVKCGGGAGCSIPQMAFDY